MSSVPDILSGFECETIPLPDDYEGKVVTSMVSRPCAQPSTRAALYVHGYCDYFFQTELAAFYNAQGFNFYAVDLRKYGRSWLAGQRFNFCLDMTEYYADLDAVMARIRHRDGNIVLLLNGHSTGGLLAAVYAHDRRYSNTINGLFLNSPFFDFNANWLTEAFLKTVVTGIGRITPYLSPPSKGLPLYAESISAAYSRGGDQAFDEKWKPASSWHPPVLAGWIRAIRLAQLRVHNGLSIKVPTLVMHSDKSGGGAAWNDSYLNSDCVLDVADIALYSQGLNKGHDPASVLAVKDGLHDLSCSRVKPRAAFYADLASWLSRTTL